MKKINIFLMLMGIMLLSGCTNPSSSGGNEEKKTEEVELAVLDTYSIEFKINNVPCFLTETITGGNSKSVLLTNKDFTESELQEYNITRAVENERLYFLDSYGDEVIGYLMDYQINDISSKEKILSIFPSRDNKIEISDIKYVFYYLDQYVGKKNDNDVFEKYRERIPEFYLNNKGANSFTSKKGYIDYMHIYEGKINNLYDKINPDKKKFDLDSLNKKEIRVDCESFTVENIWKNKSSYETLEKYMYNVELVYKDKDNERQVRKYDINLKKFLIRLGIEDLYLQDNDITIK